MMIEELRMYANIVGHKGIEGQGIIPGILHLFF